MSHVTEGNQCQEASQNDKGNQCQEASQNDKDNHSAKRAMDIKTPIDAERARRQKTTKTAKRATRWEATTKTKRAIDPKTTIPRKRAIRRRASQDMNPYQHVDDLTDEAEFALQRAQLYWPYPKLRRRAKVALLWAYYYCGAAQAALERITRGN